MTPWTAQRYRLLALLCVSLTLSVLGACLMVPALRIKESVISLPGAGTTTYIYEVYLSRDTYNVSNTKIIHVSTHTNAQYQQITSPPPGEHLGHVEIELTLRHADAQLPDMTATSAARWNPAKKGIAPHEVDRIVSLVIRRIMLQDDLRYFPTIPQDAFAARHPHTTGQAVSFSHVIPGLRTQKAQLPAHRAAANRSLLGLWLLCAGVLLAVTFILLTRRPKRHRPPSETRQRSKIAIFLLAFLHPAIKYPLLLGAAAMILDSAVNAGFKMNWWKLRSEQSTLFLPSCISPDGKCQFGPMGNKSSMLEANPDSAFCDLRFSRSHQSTLFSETETFSVEDIRPMQFVWDQGRRNVMEVRIPDIAEEDLVRLISGALQYLAVVQGVDLPELPDQPRPGTHVTILRSGFSRQGWMDFAFKTIDTAAHFGRPTFFAALFIGSILGVIRARRSNPEGLCPNCRYTLLDFQTICPECGLAVESRREAEKNT